MQPLNGMQCSLTGHLMVDPVVAADGYTYERPAIENWFQQKRNQSPVTQVKLPNTVLIPNHNLRRAIEDLIRLNPGIASLQPSNLILAAHDSAGLELDAKRTVLHSFSPPNQSAAVRLIDHKTAERKTQDVLSISLEDLTVFIKDPLRIFMDDLPGFTFKVNRTLNRVSGPRFGICASDPQNMKSGIDDFIESWGYFVDDSGWFRDPSGDSQLTSWNPGMLKLGDTVTCIVRGDGSLAIVVNSRKVAEAPMNIKLTSRGDFPNYWGFVSLSGLCASVVIVPHQTETKKMSI